MTERFFSFVYEAPNGCWLWMGGCGKRGYPHFNYENKTLYAHRVSWEIAHKRKVPKGMDVHHCCPTGANPMCVNPAHLEAIPHLKHMGFGKENGHRPRCWGEKARTAKLREAQVLDIRQRRHNGEALKDLARYYSVTPATISLIANRKHWKHL